MLIFGTSWSQYVPEVSVVVVNVLFTIDLKAVLSKAENWHYCIIKALRLIHVGDSDVNVVDSDDLRHLLILSDGLQQRRKTETDPVKARFYESGTDDLYVNETHGCEQRA